MIRSVSNNGYLSKFCMCQMDLCGSSAVSPLYFQSYGLHPCSHLFSPGILVPSRTKIRRWISVIKLLIMGVTACPVMRWHPLLGIPSLASPVLPGIGFKLNLTFYSGYGKCTFSFRLSQCIDSQGLLPHDQKFRALKFRWSKIDEKWITPTHDTFLLASLRIIVHTLLEERANNCAHYTAH